MATNTRLLGTWEQTRAAARKVWPRLTEADCDAIAGQREALLHALKIRYGKTYGELEREVTEFDFREIWAANMARPSLGIAND